MGLTCSLLGHVFDETDVEREREERGSEVVTVVRDIERCSRCGAERVLSENKEVTSVVDAAEVGLADDGGQPDGDGRPAEADAEAGDGGEDAGGGIGGIAARAGAYDDDDGETLDDGFNDDEYEPPANIEEEDAEILTDDGPTERAPGQWPDDPTDEPWEPERVTKPADGDEGVEVVNDTRAEPAPDPDPSTERDDSVEAETALETGADPDLTVPVGDLVCDACGQQIDTASSYRAGDACPACQTGWLEAEAE